MNDLEALWAACAVSPDRDVPRLALADKLDDTEYAQRSRVLRACEAIRWQVGGLLPFDQFPAFQTQSEAWGWVGERLEEMAQHPEDTPDLRRRYEQLVRGDVPLDPEHLEPTLRLQYDLQVRLLASLNLLEEDDEQRFITAIDGNRYPLPRFADILARMKTSELQRKLRQGFDTLLLVPFGLSLQHLTNAWQQGLKRNAATLQSVGQFNKYDPLWVWDQYWVEPLVYDPRSFTDNHGGHTKAEMVQAGRAWDVLLVEGAIPNLPREGQGRLRGERRQVECNRTPIQYLTDLRAHGEVGLTPEAYILHFLQTLERQGQVLDVQTFTYLTGAFLTASRYVPSADWCPEGGQASLGWDDPGLRSPINGVRPAVRVC